MRNPQLSSASSASASTLPQFKLKPVGWWCEKCRSLARHKITHGYYWQCWCYRAINKEYAAIQRKHWKRVWVKGESKPLKERLK